MKRSWTDLIIEVLSISIASAPPSVLHSDLILDVNLLVRPQPTRQECWMMNGVVGLFCTLDCFELYRGSGLCTNTIAKLFKVEGILCGGVMQPPPWSFPDTNTIFPVIQFHPALKLVMLVSPLPPPFMQCS